MMNLKSSYKADSVFGLDRELLFVLYMLLEFVYLIYSVHLKRSGSANSSAVLFKKTRGDLHTLSRV